jgi:hypothetical protein
MAGFFFPPLIPLPVPLNNHHGAVATGTPVQLIFWGPEWNDPATNPSAASLIAAVQNIISGPYLSGLRQYGIAPSTFGGAIIIDSPGPPLAPRTFNQTSIEDKVQELIDGGRFPEPDEGGHSLYIVMMPPNTIYGPGGLSGAHSFGTNTAIDTDHTWVAWIGNGTLNQMTQTFSHELVEMCTDPEHDAWTIDGQPASENEIGDICNKNGTLKGNSVVSYWSMFDNACLIPTSYSIRRTLKMAGRTLNGKGIRSIQSPIPSVRSWLRAL